MSGLFTWVPGKCETTFTHSEEPLILPTKNNGPSRAFSELCQDVTPPCNLNPLLFNGHLQTMWTAVKSDSPAVHYKRRVFEQEDENFKGHFTVDFAVVAPPSKSEKAGDGGPEDEGLREDPMGVGHTTLPPRTTYFTNKEFEHLGSEDTKPLLITLHGLSGGSYEVYLRHVIEPLIRKSEQGDAAGISGGEWEALVVNSRGCAGSRITSSILYNARATWDVRQVVKWARKTWPKRPLYAVGYSLGANILTNVGSHPIHVSLLHEIVPHKHLTKTVLFLSVPRRGVWRLPAQSSRNREQPLETRALFSSPPAHLARHGSLQQDHGQQHAQAVRDPP